MKDTEYRFLPTETKNELATEEVVEHYEGKKYLGTPLALVVVI
ncbi:hypothetical protein [Anaerotignum sp. MB30-C6]|nr:hypothetical protein [Anaerotignum sp. MB30-C6]WMI81354.1 hypothetical protein RBQ60_01085 [Anaerotignum sp. MB30-C6]